MRFQLPGHARWTSPSRRLHGGLGLPAGLRSWLLDRGSLTRRLIQNCAGQFHVKLLGQSWQRPFPDEAGILGVALGRWVLARHVLLMCDDMPLVYARTLTPKRTLSGRHTRLGHLGETPLGAVLFADPQMHRGPVQIAGLIPGMALYRKIEQTTPLNTDIIWGRRSLFTLENKPLLVYEVFLPGMKP